MNNIDPIFSSPFHTDLQHVLSKQPKPKTINPANQYVRNIKSQLSFQYLWRKHGNPGDLSSLRIKQVSPKAYTGHQKQPPTSVDNKASKLPYAA